MNTTRYYEVGNHLFSVSGEAACFELMKNYAPFEVKGAEARFTLNIVEGRITYKAVADVFGLPFAG